MMGSGEGGVGSWWIWFQVDNANYLNGNHSANKHADNAEYIFQPNKIIKSIIKNLIKKIEQ